MHKQAITFDRISTRDVLSGGRADFLPDKLFNRKQLRKGVRHEKEHTKNPELAKEIAKDHLVEDPVYYTRLEKIEKSADNAKPNTPIDMSPLNTANLAGDAPVDKLESALVSVQDELRSLTPTDEQSQTDPDTQKRLEYLRALEQGLLKLLRQRQYAIRDEFLPAEAAALGDLDLLTRPAHASKGEGDRHSFTDNLHGGFASTTGAKSANEGSVMGVVDVNALRTIMFFEGVTDEFCKRGMYIERPVEFFTGLYEGLREYFEPDATKRASFGEYPQYAVDACRHFLLSQLEVIKVAALSQVQPIAPLPSLGGRVGPIPEPQEAPAIDPERMERRQDLIDELLPHAESIQLDPDGGIKLKMPDPVARAMKLRDAELRRAQSQTEMPYSPAGQGLHGDVAGTPADGGGAPELLALRSTPGVIG